uniref:Uncharacterized protein n=1 Tax=Myotis myotis TaxID=51298 RepID=A0A7J7WI49_MYOMY|nr:hypothetical protein mMyoMyo1_012095 [Myotis myotis]
MPPQLDVPETRAANITGRSLDAGAALRPDVSPPHDRDLSWSVATCHRRNDRPALLSACGCAHAVFANGSLGAWQARLLGCRVGPVQTAPPRAAGHRRGERYNLRSARETCLRAVPPYRRTSSRTRH